MKRHCSLSEMYRAKQARVLRRAVGGALGWSVLSNGGVAAPSRGRSRRNKKHARRGSTLVVVLALLGMLMMLGMLYFSFASQELQSSINFAEAAKRNAEESDDIETIFNESIRQLIMGGDYPQKNSVLWGGRHSLLGTLIGQRTGEGQWDRQLYTGHQNSAALMAAAGLLNDSPAANDLQEMNLAAYPGADVDHTYPDINNSWLSYQATTWDPTNLSVPPIRFPIPVIKPSFHRPEVLRDGAGVPLANWAVATVTSPAMISTKNLLFRPHPEHLYVWRQQTSATPERRFIIGAASNPAADPTLAAFVTADVGLIGGGPNQVTSAFPFLKDQDGDGNYSEQGAWSRTTTAAVNTYNAYDYDVDTDGDGIPDAVWLDLDLPVLTRPSDGKKYVPLIAFKVVDLDGLLNLNAVGNLSGNTRTNATSLFGYSEDVNGNGILDPGEDVFPNGEIDVFDISRSSMGLSSYEINPIWALDAVPGLASDPNKDFVLPLAPNNFYARYFAHDPLTVSLAQRAREAGNMEWWWLNKGRVDYLAPNVIHPGRLGEANMLWQVLSAAPNAISVQQANSNLFPFPGIFDQDDNRDFNEGGAMSLAGLSAGQELPFQHPLALNGMGQYWNGPKQLSLFQAVAGNRSRWLRYTNMGIGDNGAGSGNVGWMNPFTGQLMVNPIIGATFAVPGTPTLIDDMNEIVIEPKYDPRPYDEPLEPKDSMLLQMTAADRTNTKITSRVLDLMPGSIDVTATGTSQYLPEVGKRFTTLSWDLKQFALNSNPYLGPDGAPGIVNTDDDGNGTKDDLPEIGWPGTDDGVRGWEWNVDMDGDGKLEFPPQFNPDSDNGYQPNAARLENAWQPKDPFRPQLRRLLETEFGNTAQAKQPMRLSINEFLDVEHSPGTTANPYLAPLAYRPLTPHSTDSGVTNLPPVNSNPPYPPAAFGTFSQEEVQEYWARRDRQLMARDIYVMFYTFCGGNDLTANNVTATAGATALPGNLRRQMAQFAVNVVDNLDRDNVITSFEFDTNLFNGWDLDDDVTTGDGAMGVDHPDRQTVFGVEAQQLTISEALWAQQTASADQPQTPFTETAAASFNFLFIELRSTSPTPVTLAATATTTASNAVWRIRRDDNFGVSGNPIDPGNPSGTIEAVENAITFLPPAGSINPGELFTIATSEVNSTTTTSDLYVDHDASGTTFELMIPNTGGGPFSGTAMTPQCTLDLTHPPHAANFILANGSSGDFLSYPSHLPPSDLTTIVLERRLNPDLPQLPLAVNPWIAVDAFGNKGSVTNPLNRRDLNLDPAMTTQVQIEAQLANLISKERDQPLNYRGAADSTGTGTAYRLNTITLDNSNHPAAFNLFQPQFDRDYASTMELLQVLVDGPRDLTQSVAAAKLSPFALANPASFGQAVIHNMEDRDNDGSVSATEDVANGVTGVNDLTHYFHHFHRLFSMVEVPTRSHRQLGNPLKITRQPGRVNLNTIRDSRVLGAVLDDRQVMNPPEHTGADFNGDGAIADGLQDLTGDVNRDWWFQFLTARDGVDATTSLFLPGVLGASRPFRDIGSLKSSVSTESPIGDTILRQLPLDGPVPDARRRRLFEVGDLTDAQNGNVDPVMRNRLLSKIYGNTTTRSNCFAVFVTIGMFECIESTGGPEPVVRIGGPLNQPPPAAPTQVQYRSLFILDRSEVEESFDPSGTTFDWQKLIKARQRIN